MTDEGDYKVRSPVEESRHFGVADIRAILRSRAVLKGVFAAAAIGLVAIGPLSDDLSLVIDEVVGFGFVFLAVLEFTDKRDNGRGQRRVLRSLTLLGIGVFFVLLPVEGRVVSGRLLALAIGLMALWEFAGSLRARRRGRDWVWPALKGLLMVGAAAFVAVWPAAAVVLLLLGVGTIWIFQAMIAVAFVARGGSAGEDLKPDDTERIIAEWFDRYRMTPDEAQAMNTKLFYEGAAQRARIFRFAVLMFMAAGIATLGVAQDSTAVVIGAMLIAPLMTPIMGLAAAILKGWPRRAIRTGLTVLGGVVGAIALAWLIAGLIPDLTSVINNSQITSRTSPSLLDLGIALLAGAAGAFAISRPDVSDSLPGVAVAVALVPPLTVVGITLRAGDWSQALGSLLLFMTNFVSIVVMASAVFVLAGYASWRVLRADRTRLRSAYSTLAIGLILIAIPLVLSGQRVLEQADIERKADSIVRTWLEADEDFRVTDIKIDGDDISVTIVGPGEPPSAAVLHDQLEEGIRHNIGLELRVIPERILRFGEAAEPAG